MKHFYTSASGYIYELSLNRGKWKVEHSRYTNRGGIIKLSYLLSSRKSEQSFFRQYELLGSVGKA